MAIKIDTSRTHPQLFAVTMVWGFVQLLEGLAEIAGPRDLFFTSPSYTIIRQLAPLHVWGWFSVLSAALIFIGLATKRWRMARIGLFLAFVYTTSFAISFWYSMFIGELTGITAITKWTGAACLLFFTLREPPVNLMTAKGGKK